MRNGAQGLAGNPFAWVLGALTLLYLPILGRHWLPIHDTFQVANAGFYFFNAWVQEGEIPLWFPHFAYGTVTSWYAAITMGPSLCLLLPLASLLPGVNFMHFFYVALWIDEVLMLVGACLLAGQLYRSRYAVAFVGVALIGTTLWFSHIWYNFRLFYLFPFSLYLIVRGCREGVLWRIFLAGALVWVSAIGNLPYFPALQGFVLIFFFGAWTFAHGFPWRESCARWGHRETAALLFGCVTAAVYVGLFAWGVDYEIVSGRDAGGGTDLQGFLSYGGARLVRYTDWVTGITWGPDATSYPGAVTLCLAILGSACALSRAQVPFLASAVFLFLFSLGAVSFVAPLTYFFPGMAYYRHVGHMTPLLKLFVIFLAGFGCEALLASLEEGKNGSAEGARRLRCFALAGIVVLAVQCLWSVGFAVACVMSRLRNSPLPLSDVAAWVSDQRYLSRVCFVWLVYCGTAALFAMILWHGSSVRRVILAGLLCFHAADLFSYRSFFQLEFLKPAERPLWDLSRFRPFRYVPERTKSPEASLGPFSEHLTGSIRVVPDDAFAALFQAPFSRHLPRRKASGSRWYDYRGKFGVVYNTLDVFLEIDPVWTLFRLDYWERPVGELLEAFHGRPLPFYDRFFPLGESVTTFDKVVGGGGERLGKLQVFEAVTVPPPGTAGAFLANPDYRGDRLVADAGAWERYQARTGGQVSSRVEFPETSEASRPETLSANHRALGRVQMERFGPNEAVLSVEKETPAGGWLYYADAWHPSWRAWVDGKEVPVLKANLAFKAIEIPPGRSTVRFAFHAPGLRWGIGGIWLGAALFAVWGGVRATRLLRGGVSPP